MEKLKLSVQGGLDLVSFLSLNAVVQHENCSDMLLVCDASFCMICFQDSLLIQALKYTLLIKLGFIEVNVTALWEKLK